MEHNNLNAKVICIHDHKLRYKEIREELVNELEQMDAKLFNYSVNLLISHKWKEWSESLPYGTEFQFEEGAMRDAGDELVNSLLDIRVKVQDIIEMKK
jgi:hypothetical protein